jgi:tripartite-type tricarboxylate transporter receptor subunit TctC
MKQGRRSFSAALATLPWMLNGAMANAQTSAWPNRPIRLVVPYPPGGASDISGRLQAEVLTKALGVPVVVDNRGGAGGTTGTAFVAKSPPGWLHDHDGESLLPPGSSGIPPID